MTKAEKALDDILEFCSCHEFGGHDYLINPIQDIAIRGRFRKKRKDAMSKLVKRLRKMK